MFSFLKKKEIEKTYPTGAILNPIDLRRVKLFQVQGTVDIPKKYITDISMIPVLNQKKLGACVGHAHAIVHAYHEYKETGSIKNFSPRYLYALSKKLDGYAGEGTYPEITAKIQKEKGCATESTVVNDTDLSHADYINVAETHEVVSDAFPYRNKGYAEPDNTKNGLKQAIFQNGVVAITISVGGYKTRIKKGKLGLHRVVVYGYSGDKFYFRNSWGSDWGNNGNGYFYWSDQELADLMVFTDIPDEILQYNKSLPTIRITRRTPNSKETIGDVVVSNNGIEQLYYSLELPWLNNLVNKSSITPGTYVAKWEWSNKYGMYILRIYDVIGRSGILIHPFNFYYEIEGCVGIGKTLSDINKDGYVDITDTRNTIKAIYSLFGGKDCTLIIK